MKGVVFTEFLEMVEQRYSEEFADELLESCDLPSGGIYTAVGTYAHTEMVALLTALSERTETTIPMLLRAFGQYLFGRFRHLYPTSFSEQKSALDFLESIENTIHVEVLKLYPDAQLPHFDVQRLSKDELVLIYRSERHLADLAQGLIEGCLEYFKQPAQLLREDHGGSDQYTRFTLSCQ